MASNPVEICNMMLSWLSVQEITSLEDVNDANASRCKTNYDPSRRAVLEAADWTFATKRLELTAVPESPIAGYTFQFLKPTDCIRSIIVTDPSSANHNNPPEINHLFEGDYILADIEVIHIKYIFNQENTLRFSPTFDQAVAAYMGYNLAVALTEDKVERDRMFALFEDKVSEGASFDGMQGTPEQLETSSLERSRRLFVGQV